MQAKPTIGKEEIGAVQAVLESGMLASGEIVKEFESKFSRYIGTKHAVATSSGTTALQVVFQALELGKGRRKVVTTPFTFIATSNALRYNDLEPSYADVNSESFNISPSEVQRLCTPDVGAVMPVHLYGNPAQLDELAEICEASSIPLIEDACQAHGARYKGRHVGRDGLASCFSFYPTKNMTTGEGGMITTNSAEFAEKCRTIANQGQKARYEHVMLGSNYRMTNIAAAMGLVQLAKLDKMVSRRRTIARMYDDALQPAGLAIPTVDPGNEHGFHQYTLKVENRTEIEQRLQTARVGYGIYYPKLSYDYPHLRRFASRCKNAEQLAAHVISLPMYPGLSAEDINRIIQVF